MLFLFPLHLTRSRELRRTCRARDGSRGRPSVAATASSGFYQISIGARGGGNIAFVNRWMESSSSPPPRLTDICILIPSPGRQVNVTAANIYVARGCKMGNAAEQKIKCKESEVAIWDIPSTARLQERLLHLLLAAFISFSSLLKASALRALQTGAVTRLPRRRYSSSYT